MDAKLTPLRQARDEAIARFDTADAARRLAPDAFPIEANAGHPLNVACAAARDDLEEIENQIYEIEVAAPMREMALSTSDLADDRPVRRGAKGFEW